MMPSAMLVDLIHERLSLEHMRLWEFRKLVKRIITNIVHGVTIAIALSELINKENMWWIY